MIQTAQQELEQLGAQMAEIRTWVNASKAPAGQRLREELAALQTQWAQLQPRLTELRTATLATWRQLNESFRQSLDQFKAELQHLASKARE